MSLTTSTDHAVIVALLDRLVAADPVRGTVLGTIRLSLEDTAWAVIGDDGLAVRSGASFPVLLHGRWTPAELTELTARLHELPALRGLSGPPSLVEPLMDEFAHDGPVERIGQRLFRLDELTPPDCVAGSAVVADPARRELVRAWFSAFMAEVPGMGQDPLDAADHAMSEGTCWLWCDAAGTPVSIAARRRALFGSARIGPVYTPPEQRGRGYGSAVTAAATRDILDEGAAPVLFTDLANPTSNKIYRELGYRPVEDRVVVLFE